jgi:hypothetical protein
LSCGAIACRSIQPLDSLFGGTKVSNKFNTHRPHVHIPHDLIEKDPRGVEIHWLSVLAAGGVGILTGGAALPVYGAYLAATAGLSIADAVGKKKK